jgi:hypothetical protein
VGGDQVRERRRVEESKRLDVWQERIKGSNAGGSGAISARPSATNAKRRIQSKFRDAFLR